MHKYLKWSFYSFLLLIIALCFYYREELLYGIAQGKGQVSIIWNTKPVEEILQDKTYSDSMKAQIRLIEEIRAFAFDSLGLNKNENYTTFYDQEGNTLLWNVTASEPYQLKAKEWSFPFLGAFSYKGFFDHDKAVSEEANLKKEGWDTSIDEVSGWSTLGWFKDPILSSMLKRSPGSLANLIIHELTHGTLYVKNNVQFNENLASFVGDKGAIRFLQFKYGKDSKELLAYLNKKTFNDGFETKVLSSAKRLDSLYKHINNLPVPEKRIFKQKVLKEIRKDIKVYIEKAGYLKKTKFYNEIDSINNTFFLDYRRYTQDLSVFEQEYSKFNRDLKGYIYYLKDKYPSL